MSSFFFLVVANVNIFKVTVKKKICKDPIADVRLVSVPAEAEGKGVSLQQHRPTSK